MNNRGFKTIDERREEEKYETQDLVSELNKTLFSSKRWEHGTLAVALVSALVLAIINWSSIWAAAALIIFCMQTILNVVQEARSMTMLSSDLRERDYHRIRNELDIVAHAAAQRGDSIWAEIRGLRLSLTQAGVIRDERKEIASIEALLASLDQNRKPAPPDSASPP